MIKVKTMVYMAVCAALMTAGTYLGYTWTCEEWVKKINAYVEIHPNETMNDFLKSCKED